MCQMAISDNILILKLPAFWKSESHSQFNDKAVSNLIGILQFYSTLHDQSYLCVCEVNGSDNLNFQIATKCAAYYWAILLCFLRV